MADWKDDLAETVAGQLKDDKRNQEAFNNEQKLINGQSANIWRVISDSLTNACGIINQKAGSPVITLDFPPRQSGGEVKATYDRSSPRKGNIIWNKDQCQITTSVTLLSGLIGVDGLPLKVYEFAAEGSKVVLKSNTDTVDGDGLAHAFLKALIAS
jgi:hypothetical protein